MTEAGEASPARYRVTCPACGKNVVFGEKLLGQARSCPNPQCGHLLRLEDPAGAEAATPTGTGNLTGAVPSGDPPPVPPSPPPLPEDSPERMRANKALAGRPCACCLAPLELGDEIFHCRHCGTVVHLKCHETEGGCPKADCPGGKLAVRAVRAAGRGAPDAGDGSTAGTEPGDTKPCPWCGEKIHVQAKKCRFCGEFLDGRPRAGSGGGADDESLTVWLILFGTFCGCPAAVVGLVWGLQGKKKGWKLLGIALLSQLIFGVLREMIVRR